MKVVLLLLAVVLVLGVFIASIYGVRSVRMEESARLEANQAIAARADSRWRQSAQSGIRLPERPPESSIDPVGFPRQNGDDLTAWRNLGALAPKDPNAPTWVTTAADSQPWTQAFAGVPLDGRQPGPKDRLVGYSTEFEPTKEQARARARESAIQQVVTLTLWQIHEGEPGSTFTPGDVDRLRRAFAQSYRQDFKSMERDWYDQPVQIQRDSVYRSAVQIRAPSTEKLRAVASQAIDATRLAQLRRRQQILYRAGFIVAGAIGVLGAYAGANSASRGHYALALRIVSVIAFGVILLLTLMA